MGLVVFGPLILLAGFWGRGAQVACLACRDGHRVVRWRVTRRKGEAKTKELLEACGALDYPDYVRNQYVVPLSAHSEAQAPA